MEWTTRGALVAWMAGVFLVGCGGGGGASGTTANPITESPVLSDPNDSTFVDKTSAIGFYSDGSIENAVTIPDSGPGYLKVFRLRNRNYMTATLSRTIQIAAAAWHTEFPVGDRIQLGDSTDWNGGFLSGHASHQNGLDVDIAYLRMNHIERDPNTDGSGGFGEQYVSGGTVTANFDMVRNWAIIRNLVERGNVSRIFMDPVLKNAFCKQSLAIDPNLATSMRTEVLRRLRPLDNHADHFHLRIKCPAGHLKCVAQTEPPEGTGCSEVSSASASEIDKRTPEQVADDELGEDEG